MPQARIRINGVTGSDDDLPIDTLVTLSNLNVGGETAYAWQILDQPPGAVDALSSSTAASPTFTPRKEGTYLLRLVVNGTYVDTAIAAVRQLKTRTRVPASGETTEAGAGAGWAEPAVNGSLRGLDELANGREVVAVTADTTFGAITSGTVVAILGQSEIKAGLPGAEVVGSCLAVNATFTALEGARLGVAIRTPAGALGPFVNGELILVVTRGLVLDCGAGAPTVGDDVFVDDLGLVSLTAGTYRRRIGTVSAAGGGTYSAWIDTGDANGWAESLTIYGGSTLSSPNTSTLRSNAGTLEASNNGGAFFPVQLSGAGATMTEQADPGAVALGDLVLYARSNGVASPAHRTQLVAAFNDGLGGVATVVIAEGPLV